MADEVSVRSALQISSGNVNYKSEPQSYTDDLSTTKGPVPGALSVTTTGTNVSFAELTTPGWCRMVNQDAVNFVTYGIWDGLAFWLRLVADGAACNVLVEAFEAEPL